MENLGLSLKTCAHNEMVILLQRTTLYPIKIHSLVVRPHESLSSTVVKYSAGSHVPRGGEQLNKNRGRLYITLALADCHPAFRKILKDGRNRERLVLQKNVAVQATKVGKRKGTESGATFSV